MPREGDKWRVARGDCLWNIARAVYGNGARWPEIASANGLATSGNPIIYPGQLFNLPGITSGAPAPAPAPAPVPPPITRPNIDWMALTSGSEREMLAIWSYNHNRFWIRWEQWDNAGHLIMISENKNVEFHDEAKQSIGTGRTTEGWNVIRFSVRPVDNDGNPLANTDWATKEYDFRNNPPQLPPDPEFSIDGQNKATITFNNISENINADSIEIAIYQDNTIKYKTAKVAINNEARYARYIQDVDPGHEYKVRARAVRGNIYGGWTNFTANDMSLPVAPSEITTLRPQKISEQQAVTYGVLVEWPAVQTGKQYEIQWTTNIEYFDTPSSGVNSQTTEEGQGTRLLITDIELGHEYFFRIGSINNKGHSLDWSPIKSVTLGTKPSAPTTWSNVSSAVLGEDLNLYWRHNSTDGSLETFARLHLTVIDSAHPELEPMEYTKVIENTKPEEERDQNSVYTINTTDPEWSGLLADGFIIKWKVQTAGVIGEYSDWSIEREVNVYTQPTLELDLTNKDGVSIDEINGFPFYVNLLAKPTTQKPISYYIEVISNNGYNTVDNIGEVKVINPGDKIYQRYYDPERNAWRFLLEMTPAIIDLKSGINYTINVTVSMDSGLSAVVTKDFNISLGETGYSPYANIIMDKETLTASIHPYCMENYEDAGEVKQRLSENCTLAVYRREYDGTFTEIATEIKNAENTYVVDPHPSLDYARYRIVARADETGTISYCDVKAVKVGEPSIVIQWSEKWSKFDYNPDEDNLEVPWAGSMLKLPYNVDVSENKNPDVSLIEYVGRKHPVSYYGTQIGESASWNTEIPAEDKETLYGLRRLSRWTGDVYVREPSGTGYWANITVSLNIKHLAVTIPVSFSVKRVEGGM